MNLRRKTPTDSLYLLLDTLCNAFGGIILLAVLVVLLTSKEKSPRTTAPDAHDLLQKRLVLAQSNLQKSLQLAATLTAKANDPRWKQQMALLATRKELQTSIQEMRDLVSQDNQELNNENAATPEERLKFLNAELAKAQLQKLDEQNHLLATQEELKHLQQRLANIQGQVTAKVNELQRPLRLPMEHDSSKNVFYLIVSYDRVYPCHNADMSHNETDIHWIAKSGEDEANPIPGKGLDPNNLDAYFKRLAQNNVYVAFLVFEDSFPAFLQAKQTAIDDGLSYGWEPRRFAEGPVVFGFYGHTTKAQ